MRKGGSQDSLFELKSKGGDVKYVRATFTGIKDLDGKPSKIIMIGLDNTVLRAQTQELEQTSEILAVKEEELNIYIQELEQTYKDMEEKQNSMESAITKLETEKSELQNKVNELNQIIENQKK